MCEKDNLFSLGGVTAVVVVLRCAALCVNGILEIVSLDENWCEIRISAMYCKPPDDGWVTCDNICCFFLGDTLLFWCELQK